MSSFGKRFREKHFTRMQCKKLVLLLKLLHLLSVQFSTFDVLTPSSIAYHIISIFTFL
jgi:hypothetical protein